MDIPAIPHDVQTVLTRIRGTGDLRVWSVIVTIMGDMARGPGETVSGATLSALMGTLGIRPEATRVALHRLRKDGWISSQREGRGSFYTLTDHGRAQTVAVAARIYGPGLPAPDAWHLAVTIGASDRMDAEEALTAQGFGEVASGVFLGAVTPGSCAGVLHLSDASPSLPDWVLTQLLPEALRGEATRLRFALSTALDLDLEALPPLSRAVLRILILHSWRRIALRLPDLPLDALWPDARLRGEVHGLLDRLGPITPATDLF